MTTIEERATVPSLGMLYARAAIAGVLPGSDDRLPDRELVVRGVEVDRDHLDAYARVCGYPLSGAGGGLGGGGVSGAEPVLPPTYVHVLAFPLSVALMADQRFPFALPGLVHVANRIEVRRPVTADERLDLAVRTERLRPHRKGRQFDVVVTASVAAPGDAPGDAPATGADARVVWTGTSTYLRRGDGADDAAPGPQLPFDPPDTSAVGARWPIAADTGRRYAAVSGDRNPIHLHPLTSRLFGFARPIAHGMWTAARALASLEGELPDAATYDVVFGKPLPLPSTVMFAAVPSGPGTAFAVRSRDGAPHVTGTVG